MDEHRQWGRSQATLPAHTRLPINRCNLPAVILGSLSFQQHPVELHIDGVELLHRALFQRLDTLADPSERAEDFKHYMRSSFLLDHLDEAGLRPGREGKRQRGRADYLRTLRGWLFDPDGKEAAVLKGWVESRFGLLPRNHHGPLADFSADNYQQYLTARSRGLYNTNALEAQLDLLYAYCQYELGRRYPTESHVRLFRGINRIDEHEILARPGRNNYILVLNNINSFTANRERAGEFGDNILEVLVPLSKLVYLPDLLPGALKGEEEFLVIGGVYEVTRHLF